MTNNSRRSKGEGSITKRNDGTWQGYITLGVDSATGNPKRKYFYGKTEREVVNMITTTNAQILSGTFSEPSKITFSQWIDQWLSVHKNNLKPTTYSSYIDMIQNHIKPSIGHIKLKDLNEFTLENLYNEKLKSGKLNGSGGLSPRSIEYIHAIIHNCLQKAFQRCLISKNIAEFVVLPRKRDKEIRVLSLEDQGIFIKALKGDRLEAAFALALATGVRVGELLALKWNHVDFENRIILIRSTLARVKNLEGTGATKTILIFQEPKTKAGKRSIDLPAFIIPLLKKHKKEQSQERLTYGQEYENNNLVFCTKHGTPMDKDNLSRKLKSILKKANLQDLNLHALRHTFATRALEKGIQANVVKEWLGHSNIQITLDTYSHVLPTFKKESMEKMDSLFRSFDEDPSVKENSEKYIA